jgi:sugar phosphate isomerase/epimerase
VHKLAVASSVSRDNGFDNLDALSYAIENGFGGFQAFMNDQMVNSAKLREEVRALCDSHNLVLVAHAPATLSRNNVLQDPANAAARSLFSSDNKALVVHHYDETIPVEEALECLRYLQDLGITTCLENYFIIGAKTGEKCFNDYLHLITNATMLGIDIIPVFDIPRIYHDKVNLSDKAFDLINGAFNVFSSLNTPIILHLIDVNSVSQVKSSWCPIGSGIIPYSEIFSLLREYKISVYVTILEYEDKINPVMSRQFLKDQLYLLL